MRADEIDDRDRAILRALMSDGRLTNLALAERVDRSLSACSRRVRLLEESGLIAGCLLAGAADHLPRVAFRDARDCRPGPGYGRHPKALKDPT